MKLPETANTIMIVDDTPANLHLLVQLLNREGYKTRPVPDGAKALTLAYKAPPDLVLLDIMMPGMDGYQVCTLLKANERTRDIPVIFLSALSDVLDKVRAFAVGGVDYITKPFQMEEVLARVRTHLALRAAQLQLKTAMQEVQMLYQNLQGELALARATQSSLLPLSRPQWPELEVVCYNRPAFEIGGDFYTYHAFAPHSTNPTPTRYALAVGDISGKGVPAALLMAASLSQFDASFAHEFTPAERLAYIDKTISPYTQPRKQNCAMTYVELELGSTEYGERSKEKEVQSGENQETTSYSLLPTPSAFLHILNAGCIPPYVKRTTGEVENPEIGGFALGQGISHIMTYQEIKLPLYSGDLVVLVSDGVIEAHNPQGHMLGFEGMEELMTAAPITSAEDMLTYLKSEVIAFMGAAEQHDDITIIVARV